MGTKKDIGKLFKERLEHIEHSPDAGLWDNIASELDASSKKRMTPFWFYFGGLTIVSILLSIWFLRPEIIAVKTQKTSNNPNKTTQEDKLTSAPNDTANYKEFIKNIDTSNKVDTSSNFTPSIQTRAGANAFIANGKQSSQQIKIFRSINNSISPQKKSITDKQIRLQVSSDKITHTSQYSNNTQEDKNRSIAPSTPSNKITNSLMSIGDESKNSRTETKARIAYETRIKQELEDAPVEQRQEAREWSRKQIKKKQDSLAQIQQKLLAEDLRKKSPKEKKPKTPSDREEDRQKAIEYDIAISPYTSILNYGSITKASSIDDRLVNNPREAISTVGYGVHLDYKLTENVSIRLGAGYTPLKYRTNNFQVAITNGSINIFELSAINTNDLNGSGTTGNSPQAISFFTTNNVVSIQQDISYIEVPLDVQYRFINKRIALSINPGISVFLLDNNEIFATADSGQSIFVGRDTNLNDLSFAFNLGLGGHYNINRKWRANIEPVFRYQLNPYNNSLSNFRPYYIGVQFGMSYKF